MSGKYGTDEIQKAVIDIDKIIEDVQDARAEDSPGGKKIKLSEAVGLVISDGGKVIRIVNAGDVIWEEIKDLQTSEAPEIVNALKNIYDPENPYVVPCATKLTVAIIAIKEAAEQFALARKWNPNDVKNGE